MFTLSQWRQIASLLFKPLLQATCRRGLTSRSTGPIAAGRHLGYKSLAQMPARHTGPVSSNVRPHMPPPLHFQRFNLSFLAVHIQCLGADQRPIPDAVASGFVRREADGTFLYTCWHVVAEYDPYRIDTKRPLPRRRYLDVSLQLAETRQPGVQVIGGRQTIRIPLYQSDSPTLIPDWFQDDRYIPSVELDSIGLHIPFWHDVVRLRLPSDMQVSDTQIVDEERLFVGNQALLAPGDKCIVVGYPYGFSAYGEIQPTPVALTRFVAANKVENRRQQFLLESIAAPGMSGAPVYLERDESLYLVGIYTGLIYPDHHHRDRQLVTALGTVADLTLHFAGFLKFVLSPSSPSE